MIMKDQFTETTDPFLALLKQRFNNFPSRHSGMNWDHVEKRLLDNPKGLHSLEKMEETGGEPDVIQYDPKKDQFFWVDCVKESPSKRRSICYDHASRVGRKNHPPADSAWELATAMGVRLLNEEEYIYLQSLGDFDLKTSSWIDTPEAIRQLGGALFGDKRYNHVFIYHNGADSYYAARGFRAGIWI
jgi:hypothetical protein